MTSRSPGQEIFAGLLLMALTAGFGAWFIFLSLQSGNGSLAFLSWLVTAATFNAIAFSLIGRLIGAPATRGDEVLPAAA